MDIQHLRLHPVDQGWTLRIDQVDTPAWTVSTRARAVVSARREARFHSAKLSVHDRAGGIVRVYDFSNGAS